MNEKTVITTAIKKKIAEFRREISTRNLTMPQRFMYYIFTQEKGHNKLISVRDSQNREVKLSIPIGRTSEGSTHILLKHYNEPVGRVTAFEIVNLLNVIEKGRRSDDGHNHYDYRLKQKRGNVEYTLGVKIKKKGDILKSFYPNRKK